MRLQPERSGADRRIDARIFPPSSFIAAVVNLAEVTSTHGDGELIADLAAKCAVLLGVPQMVRIRWPSSANETRLLGDKLNVVLVTKATRFRVGQTALVDAMR